MNSHILIGFGCVQRSTLTVVVGVSVLFASVAWSGGNHYGNMYKSFAAKKNVCVLNYGKWIALWSPQRAQQHNLYLTPSNY